jgi:outer membrane receptor for ferrienterochelin and colicin
LAPMAQLGLYRRTSTSTWARTYCCETTFSGSNLRYARVNLAHDLIYSDAFVEVDGKPLPAEQLAMVGGLAPEAVDSRSNIDSGGVYLFGFYSIAQTHYLNAGVRLDYSQSLRTVQPTLRVGYVGRLTPDLTVKLLFGQAVQEPTMGEILSSEGGTSMEESKLCSAECKNSGLRSEASQTLELSANYTTQYAAARVGGFYINYIDAMVPNMTNIVRNADKRHIAGGDASLQVLLPLWDSAHLNVWAYYSLLALSKQTDVDGVSKDLVPIGDLSTHKVLGGLTFRVSSSFAVTLLGRFIGERKTVQTNPLDVNAYFTLDANIVVDNLFVRGLSLSIRATNLLDATYYHPGLLDASSGQDPATFTSDKRWLAGPHNSLLPQPGREVFATLRWAL